jgi:cell division protein FtsL
MGLRPYFSIFNIMRENSKEKVLFVLNIALLVLLWFTINVYRTKLSVIEKRVTVLEQKMNSQETKVVNEK